MKLWKRLMAIGLALSLIITTPNIAFAAPEESVANDATKEPFVTAYKEGELMDTSFVGEQKEGDPAVQSTLASSYSSVDKGYITEVKSQNGGTCWAHAAVSIAETSYIINKGVSANTVDFNEYHLVHYNNHTPEDLLGLYGGDYNAISGATDLDRGGNNSVALVTFANWIGASDDTLFTSSDVGADNPDEDAYKDAAHLREAYVLTMPDMTNPEYATDMNIIKQMIVEYGSVAISYYADQQYGYYNNGYQYIDEAGADWETNHAVTVVGWDDTISASNFTHTPPGDGAWLVKNSWDTYWGNDGYFWLSYYDTTIYENAFVYDFIDSDDYDNNYSYDGAGSVSTNYAYGYQGQICGANVFVADSSETLEAVGFYTSEVNSDYEIRIYRGLEKDALPNEGALVGTYTGTETYVGFHTLDLDTPISLMKGERYAIVVTLKKEGTGMFFPAAKSYSWGWISFTNYAKVGESYVGRDVTDLSDVNASNTEYAEGTSLRIKAFTNEAEEVDVVDETGISLNHSTASIKAGQTLQLQTTITPFNATYQEVVYTSSNTSLVTVDSNGLVRVNEEGEIGTATITARTINKNLVATCQVTVEPGPVTEIRVSNNVEAYVGQMVYISATAYPVTAANRTLAYTSSNPSVVTVGEDGLFSFNKAGTATITISATDGSGVTASCKVNVKNALIEDIYIPDSITLVQGSGTNLSPGFNPYYATNKTLKWSSSDPTVATVDADGWISAKKAGRTTITASATDGSGVTASCEVYVQTIYVSSIELPEGEISLKKGESIQFYPTVLPYDASNQKLEWKSSNTAVATVDENGLVTAKNIGFAQITAMATDGSGITATRRVIVSRVEPVSLTLDKGNVTLDAGETVQLNASLFPKEADSSYLTWESSNVNVVKVDSKGKVTAVSTGTAIITVSTTDGSNLSDTCVIKVEKIKSYSITYVLNGGKNNAKNPSVYTSLTETITLKKATRKGYTFKGWYSDSKFKKKVSKIEKGSTGDKTLYAKWEKTKYTITYKLNSGKNNAKNPKSYTITTKTITLKSPTRKGYTFKGWYSDSKFKKKVTKIAKGSTGNKTLYAKWEKTKYKITYVLKGGKNSTKNPSKYTITTKTITLKKPTRKGYTFKGWYSDSKYKNKVTKIKKGSTGNIKLYAKWVKNK